MSLMPTTAVPATLGQDRRRRRRLLLVARLALIALHVTLAAVLIPGLRATSPGTDPSK
jgi:hypothetical protein